MGASIGTLRCKPYPYSQRNCGRADGVMKGSKFNKARYLSTLKMMYQFLNKVRKEGLLSVEMDVEKPKAAGSSRTTLSS